MPHSTTIAGEVALLLKKNDIFINNALAVLANEVLSSKHALDLSIQNMEVNNALTYVPHLAELFTGEEIQAPLRDNIADIRDVLTPRAEKLWSTVMQNTITNIVCKKASTKGLTALEARLPTRLEEMAEIIFDSFLLYAASAGLDNIIKSGSGFSHPANRSAFIISVIRNSNVSGQKHLVWTLDDFYGSISRGTVNFNVVKNPQFVPVSVAAVKTSLLPPDRIDISVLDIDQIKQLFVDYGFFKTIKDLNDHIFEEYDGDSDKRDAVVVAWKDFLEDEDDDDEDSPGPHKHWVHGEYFSNVQHKLPQTVARLAEAEEQPRRGYPKPKQFKAQGSRKKHVSSEWSTIDPHWIPIHLPNEDESEAQFSFAVTAICRFTNIQTLKSPTAQESLEIAQAIFQQSN